MAQDLNPQDAAPSDQVSYVQWLTEKLEVSVNDRLTARYDAVVNKVKRDFEASKFWRQAIQGLVDFDADYRLEAQNYPLFLNGDKAPELVVKSFDSYLLKTFRRNVLENPRWPDPPEDGWIRPDQDFQKMNDLVRTSFVVKYLDGVEFLGEKLTALGMSYGCSCQLSFEARAEGHYAAHLCVMSDFDVPTEKWTTEQQSFSIEIQITTQLQEVIRRLTHKYYEDRREQPIKSRSNWQWNYKSDEFTANYLGHILHYVEGMIMEVRTRQPTTKGTVWSERS